VFLKYINSGINCKCTAAIFKQEPLRIPVQGGTDHPWYILYVQSSGSLCRAMCMGVCSNGTALRIMVFNGILPQIPIEICYQMPRSTGKLLLEDLKLPVEQHLWLPLPLFFTVLVCSTAIAATPLPAATITAITMAAT